MDAGSQVELPMVIVVVRLPVGGEIRNNFAFRVQGREPVKHHAAGDAIGAAPWVAFNLNAQ
jgi:hypothetical protein